MISRPIDAIGSASRSPNGISSCTSPGPIGTDLPLDAVTILLVEDEALLALDLQATLEDAGATVIGPIPSLTKAIKAAREARYDAAILDIDLQGQSVLPAAAIIAGRSIPFLFHTAYGEDLGGSDEFADVPLCSKPNDPEELVRILHGLLGKSREN
jgi:DNA-binding response OmpR family regulator